MATRYVSSNGNNSNPGTEESPFLTLAHALSVSSGGDTILLRSGDTFFGQLSHNKSNITWGIYGGTRKAIFSGFVALSGWVDEGGGLWSSTNASLGSTLNKLVIGTKGYAKGRISKFNEIDHGYLTVSSGTTSSLSNPALSGKNYTGAQLILKSSLYTMDILSVTGHSGSTVNFSGSLTYGAAKNGYGFFIQNHIDAVTEYGDWMYDSTNKKVYLHLGGVHPSTLSIRASAATNCINASGGTTNVTFENIVLEGANVDGAYVGGSNTYTFNKCEVRYCGGDGINAPNHPNLTVTNSYIHNINNIGIWTTVGSSNAEIYDNLVEYVGLDVGMTKGGVSTAGGYGIHAPWGGTKIKRNTVRYCGYIGIRYEKAYSECVDNTVHDCLLRHSDGGGTYNWNGSTNLDHQPGMKNIGNIIFNIPNRTQGTTYGSFKMAQGNYHDDHSAGSPEIPHQIYNNLVYDVDGTGYNLRNVEYMDIQRNLSFNCAIGLRIVADTVAPWLEYIEGLKASGNMFVAKTASQMTMALHANHGDLASWSTPTDWNNNVLARPISEGAHITTQNGPGGNTNRNLAGWKAFLGWDADSTGSPVTVTDTDQFRLEANPTDEAVTLNLIDGVYVDMKGVTQSSTVSLAPHRGLLLIRTVDATTPNDPIKEVYTDGFDYDATDDINPVVPAISDVVQGESQMDNPLTDVVWNDGKAMFFMDFDSPTQTGSTVAGRTEHTTRYPALMQAEGMWFSASYEVPYSVPNDPEEEVIFQWHTGDIGGSPNFSLRIRNGRFVPYLWIGTGFLNQMAFDIGEVTRDARHDFIVKLKMHPTDGELTIWHNGIIARCHNPLTGSEWIVPTTPPGGGITNDYTAYPELGAIQQTESGSSLLVWYGKTARGTYPNPTKYPKWGYYKSAWSSRYNSDKSIKPEAYDPSDPLFVAPEFRQKTIFIDNVKFETRDSYSNLEIYRSLDINGYSPLETPDWWDEPETYTVTATGMGNGSVTGGGIYEAGSTAELTAVPDSGFRLNYFENVTNDTVTTDNPYSFTVNQDTTVRAYFAAIIPTYSVTVTSRDGGTAYGGGGEYQTGQIVSISAVRDGTHVFKDWTIENVFLSDQENYNYTVGDEDVVIQANFEEFWSINLTATAGGSVSGGGMKFADDFPITVEATASTGYVFDGWYNPADELASGDAQYTFTPTSNNVQLQARFVEIEYDVEWEVSGSGAITELTSGPYNYGDTLRLQAIPTSGSSFTKWTRNGDDYSTEAVIEWTVNQDAEFVAIFEDIPTYSVTLQAVGNGVISDSNSPGPYREGKKLQYIADSSLGSRFVRWELNGVPVGNYYIIDLTIETSDLTLTAIFEDIPEEELVYWRKYNTLGVYIGKEVIAPPINVPCNSLQDIMVGRDHVVSMDRVFDAVRINYRYAYERDATQSSNMIRNGNFAQRGSDSPIDWVRWGRSGVDPINIEQIDESGIFTDGITTGAKILHAADPRRELQYGLDIPVKVGDELYLEWYERVHDGVEGGKYNGVYTIYLESSEREASRGRDGGTLGTTLLFLGNNGVTTTADNERGQRHPDAISYRKHDTKWSEERVYFMSWPNLMLREELYNEHGYWAKIRVHLPEISMNGSLRFRAHGVAELWRPGKGNYRPFPSFVPASGDWTLATAFYQTRSGRHLSLTGFFMGVAVDPKSELVPSDHPYIKFNPNGGYSDRFEPIEIFNGDAKDPNHVSTIRVPTAGDEILVWNTKVDAYDPSSLGLITAYSIMDQYKEPYKMIDGVLAIRGIKFDSEITFESLPDHKFIIQRGTFSDYRLDGNFSGTLVQLAPHSALDGGFDNGNTTEGRWIPTGNTRCRKNNRTGVNTGMVQREEKDINPSSQTADQTRWVDTEEDLVACPIGGSSDYWWGSDTSVLDVDNMDYAPVTVDEDGSVTVPFSNTGGLYLYFLHKATLGVVEEVYTPVQVQTISDWQYLSDVTIGGDLFRVLRQNYATGEYREALLTFGFNS